MLPTITPDLLLRAYRMGVFPMADSRDSPDVFWMDPPLRGVLPLDMHLSRSLRRRIRQGDYRVTLNAAFSAVLDGCASRPETWINATIRDLYTHLHQQGHAHSLEITQGGALIGGVYGVAIGGAFFGESMFSTRRDGSKLALAHLTHHLWRCGFVLFDTQYLTPHLASLGAMEIRREVYQHRLAEALQIRADIRARPLSGDPQEVLQRRTQTS